jgi:hypothetical protein
MNAFSLLEVSRQKHSQQEIKTNASRLFKALGEPSSTVNLTGKTTPRILPAIYNKAGQLLVQL